MPARDTAGGDLSLQNVVKTFGSFTAVDDLSLTVPQGSFFALLGPSGCGKTTTLRMVAGLEDPTSGRIGLGDLDITHEKPYKRPVNTVFQNYALFPHLDVFENVAFGLRRRGVKDVRGQVEQALDLVELRWLARRKPAQLSGGQQQRIALARAVVNRPQVLLLDEPLGALDLKLRRQMQLELKRIQREVGITFIHVTHDQEEALTLSDRVAVFNNGRIEQIGTAREVYEYPQTEFVARFLGLSNIIPAQLGERLTGRAQTMSVRPERVRLVADGDAVRDGDVSLEGTVAEIVYTGPTTRVVVDSTEGLRLIAESQNTHHPAADVTVARGDRVRVAWAVDHAALLP